MQIISEFKIPVQVVQEKPHQGLLRGGYFLQAGQELGTKIVELLPFERVNQGKGLEYEKYENNLTIFRTKDWDEFKKKLAELTEGFPWEAIEFEGMISQLITEIESK